MVPLYYIVRLAMLFWVCLVLRCKTVHSFCLSSPRNVLTLLFSMTMFCCGSPRLFCPNLLLAANGLYLRLKGTSAKMPTSV